MLKALKKYLPDILILVGIFFAGGAVIDASNLFEYHQDDKGIALFGILLLTVAIDILTRAYFTNKRRSS